MNIADIYSLYQQYPIVVTDTRDIIDNSIFFALKGESFNGNLFAIEAIKKGAQYAIIDEDVDTYNPSLIKVDNVLETLQNLARHHRDHFDIPVIGITGTNGKTTSKELILAILTQEYNVIATTGNFNNHIGVPLTLLRIAKEHEIAIIEMGANHAGEIKELCQIADPNYGIVTNVGLAHLEGFGSYNNIINTKIDLYKHVNENNGINFSLSENSDIHEKFNPNFKFINYSCKRPESDNYGFGKVIDSTLQFNLEKLSSNTIEPLHIQTNLVGLYNESNIMAAITIGNYFKIPLEKIKSSLEEFIPDNNRSQLIKTSENELILDAYNANPTSVLHAIDNIAEIKHSKKIIILGDMFELGQYANAKHQEIVNILISLNKINSILIGKDYKATNINNAGHIQQYESINDFINSKEIESLKNSLILIKGSRG